MLAARRMMVNPCGQLPYPPIPASGVTVRAFVNTVTGVIRITGSYATGGLPAGTTVIETPWSLGVRYANLDAPASGNHFTATSLSGTNPSPGDAIAPGARCRDSSLNFLGSATTDPGVFQPDLCANRVALGPLFTLVVQQFTTPTRGAATLSITNTLPSTVKANSLVVVLFWNASNDAVNNTVSGLSATWTYVRSSGYGLAYAIVPGGGTTVTLSIGATRTMAMTVCEMAVSQVPTSITGTINGNFGAPAAAINTDTITTAQTVADFWAIKGNTTAPTTYNDLLPALSWSQLARGVDATDTVQFGGAVPTARAAGTAGIAPTDPTSGVGDTAQWQLVLS